MVNYDKRGFTRQVVEYLELQAASRRLIADEEPEASTHHKRASAELHVLAEHVEQQDETHVSLSELYAWEEASAEGTDASRVWHPNPAQAEAIRSYSVGEKDEEPDALLAELARLSA